MSAPVLEVRHVSRILPGPVPVTLIDDVSLVFEAGEFAAITGPSGSGKSSLLYLLGLLDTPTEGEILIEGADASRLDDDARAGLRLGRLGFVFQFHFLLPEFSALENVLIPMRRLGRVPPSEMTARAQGLLERFGLGAMGHRLPEQLSGGERQRVAVARALANDPLVILADEPTGNLDSVNARAVFDIFAGLAREQGRTVIMVTHETDLAAAADRRVELLDGRLAGSRG